MINLHVHSKSGIDKFDLLDLSETQEPIIPVQVLSKAAYADICGSEIADGMNFSSTPVGGRRERSDSFLPLNEFFSEGVIPDFHNS